MIEHLLEIPRQVKVGKKKAYLYSPTVGVWLLGRQRISRLEIDESLITAAPWGELLRLAVSKRAECCAIGGLLFCKGREALTDKGTRMAQRLTPEGVATLLGLMLTELQEPARLKKESGLEAEAEEISRIAEVKKQSSTAISYGGRTIYGQLILPGCEIFHCTPRQLLWEVEATTLMLCLADRPNSIYLSAEERMKAHLPDPEAIDIENLTLEQLRQI